MDIQETLKRLIASGMTQEEIAAATNRRQPTICNAIKYGIKDPSYTFVVALQELVAQRLTNNNVEPV